MWSAAARSRFGESGNFVAFRQVAMALTRVYKKIHNPNK